MVAEVQQNSNVTYRVYDYGRVGADGKPPCIACGKGIDVTLCTPPVKHDFGEHLAQCEYFTVDARNGAFADAVDEKRALSRCSSPKGREHLPAAVRRFPSRKATATSCLPTVAATPCRVIARPL